MEKQRLLSIKASCEMIADYFQITVDELMSGEIEKAHTEEVAANDERMELLEEARRNPDLKVLFSLGKMQIRKNLKSISMVLKL